MGYERLLTLFFQQNLVMLTTHPSRQVCGLHEIISVLYFSIQVPVFSSFVSQGGALRGHQGAHRHGNQPP
jgi:hypothetical protein